MRTDIANWHTDIPITGLASTHTLAKAMARPDTYAGGVVQAPRPPHPNTGGRERPSWHLLYKARRREHTQTHTVV